MSSRVGSQVVDAQALLESSTTPRPQWEALYCSQRHELHGAFAKRMNAISVAASRGETPIILLDVEGTTTPLPFVTKVLYPESTKKFSQYVSDNYKALLSGGEIFAASEKDATVKAALGNGHKDQVVHAFVKHLAELVQKNEKAPYLKSIQGKIWRVGYEGGSIKGHLFEDVAKAIQRWSVTGLADVHIYSSGSIQAQKLLFRHSSHGDLTPYLKGYHDTVSAGPKFQPESYRKIQAAVGAHRPIIFLTDILAEVNAATEAGVTSVLSLRPLNKPLGQDDVVKADSLIQQQHQAQPGSGLIAGNLLTMCSFAQLPGAVEEESTSAWQSLQQSTVPYRSRTLGTAGPLKSFL